MSDDQLKYIQQWIAKADEDLRVVHQLMNCEFPVYGAIAYHCQQSAEKFLKASLAFNGREFPRTHNIEFLLSLCSEIDNNYSKIDPGNLTDFGVEVRYPGDFLEPDLKEIEELIEIVDKIREITLNIFR